MQATDLKSQTPPFEFKEMLVKVLSRNLPGSPETQATRAEALTSVILAEMKRLGIATIKVPETTQ